MTNGNNSDEPKFRDPHWDDLNLTKFFVLTVLPSSGIRIITYPFWNVKTRLQVQQHHVYNGVKDAFQKIYKTEGIKGFYRGFFITWAGNIPSQFAYLGALEFTRARIPSSWFQSSPHEEVYKYFIAGGLASFISITMTVPIDIISQRLMVQSVKSINQSQYSGYRGSYDAIKSIWASEGIRGMYRGYGATLITIAPQSAIWWSTYALTKSQLRRYITIPETPKLDVSLEPALVSPSIPSYPIPIVPSLLKYASIFTPSWQSILVNGISGITAGVISAIVTNPLDIAKTRLQVLYNQVPDSKPLNTFSMMRKILNEEGFPAMFRGVTLRMVTMSIVTTLTIVVYDHMKGLSKK